MVKKSNGTDPRIESLLALMQMIIDLRLDIMHLTRLSFDTVTLPGAGEPDEDGFPIV